MATDASRVVPGRDAARSEERLVRQWAEKGSRPRQPVDQRYDSGYVFGAVCPARDTGAALVLPYANTDAMQMHLEAKEVAAGAHAVVLLDKAGWHTTQKLIDAQ